MKRHASMRKNFGDKGDRKVTGQMKALAATLGTVLIGGLLLAVPLASAAPTVTIDPASELELTTAKASGAINPNGKETNYHFEYLTDAAFNAATDAQQDVYIWAGGGAYTLTFNGQTTPSLPFNASPSTVEGALNALSSIGGVGGSVTAGRSPNGAGPTGDLPWHPRREGDCELSRSPPTTVSTSTSKPFAPGMRRGSAARPRWASGASRPAPRANRYRPSSSKD